MRSGLRAFFLALVALFPLACPEAAAAAKGHAARPASAPSAAQTPTPSAAELQALVNTLQDDKARAALVRQLQALIAAQRQAAPAPAAPPDFSTVVSQRLHDFAGEVLAGVAVILDAPRVIAWAREQVTDETARALWSEVLLACAIVFGVAGIAEWVIRRLAARRGQPSASPRRDDRLGHVMSSVMGLFVEILPIAGFGAAALAAMTMTLAPYSIGRDAIMPLLQATIGVRLILAAANAILVPAPGWPSLVPAGEETRTYLMIWVRRFTCWTFFGYGIVASAWWLSVPGAIYGLMLKIVGLGLAVLGVVFILQNREPAGRWIAGGVPLEARGWARWRRRLGESWHVLAIFYIGAIYLAYSLHDEVGSAYVLRATALSLAAMIAARLLVRAVERLSDRGFAVAPDLKVRFPQLEARANRYLPIVVGLATTSIYVLAVLVVLQAWDLGAFEWFATGFGHRLFAAVVSMALVVAVALVAWELFAAAIERNLAALDHNGAPSRARRRTLLPLLRTAMACLIILVAALTILSQIGLDIGPLLAGAGVIGVAVGFGSQALIKDLITGVFILIEDQIAVGDIVDLGKEHAGVVEAISIRTIRLRDLGGVVHTVPFSEVTTIKNLTKDFAFAVARVTIAYGEDIDRVVEILRGVCAGLAADPELGPLILDPFDYQGVDSLNEFSVVLLLRVRTLPAKQWVVGRALNRLIKIAFDQHGIAMRDPSPVRITSPAEGNAAPIGLAEVARRSA